MNIVLLEDEISQQVRVEKHVKAIAEEEGLRLNIVSTSKIAELKEYLTNGDFHQLFFLDIDIKGDEKAGIKAAQMIREVNPFCNHCFYNDEIGICYHYISLQGISSRIY